MILSRELRRFGRALVWPVLAITLTGYFGYHIVEGDRGLLARTRLTTELQVARTELATAAVERAELEHRVSHMRPDHVDPDLLDSQIRKTLDLVSPGEIVIMEPPGKR